MQELRALSVLDGRYGKQVEELRDIFSEYGLIRRRVQVEALWLEFLLADLKLAPVNAGDIDAIRAVARGCNIESAKLVKGYESKTNHDVKAVEYYIKEQLAATGLSRIGEWVHFACTSEDINNTAYALMLRDGRDEMVRHLEELRGTLAQNARQWRAVPLMARTHGQPASPTTVGKEFVVFAARLDREIKKLRDWRPEAKMNGATGNFNAHAVALPKIDWIAAAERFLNEKLGVTPLLYTTQINPYHHIAELLQTLMRTAQTVVDLDRDLWGYISLGYFRQRTVAGEVGSSTMPHKVNPIDFENSEGNCGMAVALMGHLSEKLLVSRFQRDLTDSTTLRNLGTLFGHLLIALKSTRKGLGKLELHEAATRNDLAANPELLAEAIQTVMRMHGEEKPYERLKELTRGERIDAAALARFVDTLTKVPKEDRDRLRSLTPAAYTGLAAQLVDRYLAAREEK
ncbi:MAG TPA: adenylosuccinate lyase [bacterium]|nr:adenylosuccinate lyase [bacterium]